MQLPYSEELNIGYLSKLFENTTNCYKFFWFQAILRKMDGVRSRFTFDELINEMIADAWYMVTEYHLRLGPLGITDNLEEVVKYIHEKYGFAPAEKREKILEFLQEVEDKRIIKYKSDLTLNVPYRLQVPFYDEINIARSMWNGSKKILISEINRQKRLIYYFARISGLRTIIEVDEVWAEYLLKHKEILKGWTQLKLIQYLQNKNPSVPGIADKIEAPISRDIERVRKYWKLIIQIDPSLRDIYGDILLKARRLTHECCNYCNGNCLLLDDGEECVCVQSISYSLLCRWFKVAVLPLDAALCAEITKGRGEIKRCAVCGAAFTPNSNRAKYCPDCAVQVRRKKEAERQRKRYLLSTHLGR